VFPVTNHLYYKYNRIVLVFYLECNYNFILSKATYGCNMLCRITIKRSLGGLSYVVRIYIRRFMAICDRLSFGSRVFPSPVLQLIRFLLALKASSCGGKDKLIVCSTRRILAANASRHISFEASARSESRSSPARTSFLFYFLLGGLSWLE
jgi:hypothetical protein